MANRPIFPMIERRAFTESKVGGECRGGGIVCMEVCCWRRSGKKSRKEMQRKKRNVTKTFQLVRFFSSSRSCVNARATMPTPSSIIALSSGSIRLANLVNLSVCHLLTAPRNLSRAFISFECSGESKNAAML